MTLADDSELEVEALGDPPGVCSARFAGPEAGDEENYRLLLKMLAGRPARERRARLRCVMAIAVPGEIYLARGSCPGRIAKHPHGSGGFGYDPIFIYEPAGLTMARLNLQIKNRISDRGQALRRAHLLIEDLLRRHRERNLPFRLP